MATTILRAGKIAACLIVATLIAAVILYAAGVFTIAQTAPSPPDTTIVAAAADTAAQTETTLTEQRKRTTTALTADNPDPATAATALDNLLTDFAQNKQLPNTLHTIVQKAVKAGNYHTVAQLCTDGAEDSTHPDSALWLAMASALAASYQADDAALDAATEHLSANFAHDPRCIEAFGQIAYSFRRQKKIRPLAPILPVRRRHLAARPKSNLLPARPHPH